jgi:hypothetical protein
MKTTVLDCLTRTFPKYMGVRMRTAFQIPVSPTPGCLMIVRQLVTISYYLHVCWSGFNDLS